MARTTRCSAVLDGIAAPLLPVTRCRSVNDVVCGWAGALAGSDGISIVAGTGSMAYGEYSRPQRARQAAGANCSAMKAPPTGLRARACNLFSRMSDGRVPKELRCTIWCASTFDLQGDLDLCAAVYGPPPLTRSELAALGASRGTRRRAPGDMAALRLFARRRRMNSRHIVHAVRDAARCSAAGARCRCPIPAACFSLDDLLFRCRFEARCAAATGNTNSPRRACRRVQAPPCMPPSLPARR